MLRTFVASLFLLFTNPFFLCPVMVLFGVFHHIFCKPFHLSRVIVEKESTHFRVQCGNSCHILRRECKVEYIPGFLFLCIGSICVDFGITTTPRCKCQRRITCAALLPYFFADFILYRILETYFLCLRQTEPRPQSVRCTCPSTSLPLPADRKDVPPP